MATTAENSKEVMAVPSTQDYEDGSCETYLDPVKERRMMRKFDVSFHDILSTNRE